jgi:hypothetical protein
MIARIDWSQLRRDRIFVSIAIQKHMSTKQPAGVMSSLCRMQQTADRYCSSNIERARYDDWQSYPQISSCLHLADLGSKLVAKQK